MKENVIVGSLIPAGTGAFVNQTQADRRVSRDREMQAAMAAAAATETLEAPGSEAEALRARTGA